MDPLKSLRHVYPSPTPDESWVRSFVTALLNENPDISNQQQLKLTMQGYLESNLDASSVSGTGLPAELWEIEERDDRLHQVRLFQGPKERCLVQVTAMTEIGASAFSLQRTLTDRREARSGVAKIRRLQGEDEDEAEEEGDDVPKYQRGMLKLELSDGAGVCSAVEYKRIPSLKLGDTKLGCKLLLQNVLVLRGTLMLTPETCQVKGGDVEDFWRDGQDEETFEQSLRGRMGKEPLAHAAAIVPVPLGQAVSPPPPPAPRASAARQPAQAAPPAPRVMYNANEEEEEDDYIPEGFGVEVGHGPIAAPPPRHRPRAAAAPPPPPPPPAPDLDDFDGFWENFDEADLIDVVDQGAIDAGAMYDALKARDLANKGGEDEEMDAVEAMRDMEVNVMSSKSKGKAREVSSRFFPAPEAAPPPPPPTTRPKRPVAPKLPPPPPPSRVGPSKLASSPIVEVQQFTQRGRRKKTAPNLDYVDVSSDQEEETNELEPAAPSRSTTRRNRRRSSSPPLPPPPLSLPSRSDTHRRSASASKSSEPQARAASPDKPLLGFDPKTGLLTSTAPPSASAKKRPRIESPSMKAIAAAKAALEQKTAAARAAGTGPSRAAVKSGTFFDLDSD